MDEFDLIHFELLCTQGTSFIHAACSLEGARSVLAFLAFTRAAEDAPSSDSP